MRPFVLEAAQWLVLALAGGAVLRLLLGPRAADRVAALNVLSGLALAFLVLRALVSGRAIYLDVALVYDIFGFLGLLAIARFLKDKPLGEGEGAGDA